MLKNFRMTKEHVRRIIKVLAKGAAFRDIFINKSRAYMERAM